MSSSNYLIDENNQFFGSKTSSDFEKNEINIINTIDNGLGSQQPLKFINDFYESLTHKEYPKSNIYNSNETFVAFEFELLDYTCTKEIFLDFTLGALSKPGFLSIDVLDNASFLQQNHYVVLDNIDNIKVSIGNNKFTLGSEQVYNTMQLKNNLRFKSKSRTESVLASTLGLERSLVNDNEKMSVFGPFDFNTKGWTKSLLFFGNNTNSNILKYYSTSIPLYFIIPFFNQENSYLPKGTKIYIDIQFMSSINNRSLNGLSSVGANNNGLTFFVPDLNNIFNPNIMYNYKKLTFENRELMLNLWQNSAFTYNYMDWSYQYFTFVRNNRNFSQFETNLFINLTKPIELVFAVELRDGFYGSIKSLNGDITYNSKYKGDQPYLLTDLVIYANGSEIKTLKGRKFASQGSDSYDNIILNSINENCTNKRMHYFCVTTSNNYLSSAPFRFILTPGDLDNVNFRPTGSGPINLTISANVTSPIYKITNFSPINEQSVLKIYYKNHVQLLMDNTYTVTTASKLTIST